MIRKLMRVLFPKIIDILFIISAIGVLIAAFSVGGAGSLHVGFIVAFLTILIPGLVGVVVGFGVIYVLLDIRDSLQDRSL